MRYRFFRSPSLLAAIVLAAGAHAVPVAAGTFSGAVFDERGAPIVGADLDFVVVATGDEPSVSGDFTGAGGTFSVVLPPDVYDVFVSPPPGAPLAGRELASVNLNVDRAQDIVLLDAWVVRGNVFRGDVGGPAVGVDLDFEDVVTGTKLFTPSDNADVTGSYAVLVPPGVYRVTLDGPEPELVTDPPQLGHALIEEVTIDGSGDVTLPDATLPRAFHLTGEVLDPISDGVPGADLDVYHAGTRDKVFTKNDNTDGRGRFDTLLPAGTYDIEIHPPAGAGLASTRRAGVIVAADGTLGSIVLAEGVPVAGDVIDADGRPLEAVDLALFDGANGARLPTAFDDTDGSGQHLFFAVPGTYDVEYRPLRNGLVRADVRLGVGLPSASIGTAVLPWADTDGDGTADRFDVCPFVAGPQLDGDADGFGDACDNCPAVSNVAQRDGDRDGAGDGCDPDDDGDGLADGADGDRDGDGVPNPTDSCPDAANADQRDGDGDGQGDACDPDDGEVQELWAEGDGFRWSPESGATAYRVYRLPGAWRSGLNYGTCRHSAPDVAAFADDEAPPPGEFDLYLVTAVVGGAEGSLGRASDGSPRPNLRPCP